LFQIRAICGESMKAYGRDAGRNTEGRRNHIDSRGYDSEDGSKRMRIRFFVQGSRGRVMVWAEVRVFRTVFLIARTAFI
jgi:hypothetical protein